MADMQAFAAAHAALLMKHARRHVRVNGEKIPAEDVVREMEIEILQLAQRDAVAGEAPPIASPDLYLRTIAKHACGRAKRRRKLIEQVAAGDDLGAVSDDLVALERDLPDAPREISPHAAHARQKIEKVKAKLSPRDALVFALLYEDETPEEDTSRALAMPMDVVEAARARIAEAAGDVDVATLAAAAGTPPREDKCVDEPLIALMRDGDQADDLNDAIAHVAACPDCRARLTEGRMEKRQVTVVAIEAPEASVRDLAKVAEEENARLVERGQGRWTAVVDAERAPSLIEKLEKPESSVVSRLAVATPFEVPIQGEVEDSKAMRARHKSIPEVPSGSGIDAAEVHAWAQVGRKPRQRVGTFSPAWMLLALVAIGAAVAVAYFLATR